MPPDSLKVLVTGAAGFLGSHLVDALLAQGRPVVAFDHRLHGKCLSKQVLARVHAVEGDVTNLEALQSAAQGADVILHCAAMVGVDTYSKQPARTMEVEETGLRNVCAVAIGQGTARVVYASSSAVYGQAGGPVGLEEDLPVAPVSNYAIAKRFGELYLAAQYAESGLRSVSLRIFNIYGPRQDSRLVIPRFIAKALAGQPLELFGSGTQTRDFVYVADVVAAALAAGPVTGCEIVNACSGIETSVRSLAENIIRLTRSRSTVVFHDVPGERKPFEVAQSFGSRKKLQRFIGQLPPTTLAAGLEQTISSFERVLG